MPEGVEVGERRAVRRLDPVRHPGRGEVGLEHLPRPLLGLPLAGPERPAGGAGGEPRPEFRRDPRGQGLVGGPRRLRPRPARQGDAGRVGVGGEALGGEPRALVRAEPRRERDEVQEVPLLARESPAAGGARARRVEEFPQLVGRDGTAGVDAVRPRVEGRDRVEQVAPDRRPLPRQPPREPADGGQVVLRRLVREPAGRPGEAHECLEVPGDGGRGRRPEVRHRGEPAPGEDGPDPGGHVADLVGGRGAAAPPRARRQAEREVRLERGEVAGEGTAARPRSGRPAAPRSARRTRSSSIRRATALSAARGTRLAGGRPGIPAPYHLRSFSRTTAAPGVPAGTRRPPFTW